MAKDKARAYSDRKLKELEKGLERAYAQAKSEVEAEWTAYMDGVYGQARGKSTTAIRCPFNSP